jgi:hypothetical protein
VRLRSNMAQVSFGSYLLAQGTLTVEPGELNDLRLSQVVVRSHFTMPSA